MSDRRFGCDSVGEKNVDNCVVCLKLPGFCWHRLDVVFDNFVTSTKFPIGLEHTPRSLICAKCWKKVTRSKSGEKKMFKVNAQYSFARRLTAVKSGNIGNCINNERPVQRRVFSNIIAIIDFS